MLKTAIILLSVAVSATASSSSSSPSPGGTVHPLLPRNQESQPLAADFCDKGQKRCFWGCIDDHDQCCFDINRDEPWSCPEEDTCGGAPRFGCYRPPAAATTTTSSPPPARTSRYPRPGEPGFNPTFTVSDHFDPPRTTTKNAERPGSTQVVAESSSPGVLSTRDTCFFGAGSVAVAAAAEDVTGSSSDLFGGCPPALTSVTNEVGGSGLVVRARSWVVVTMVGVLGLLLAGGLA
ncbi:hypothetical protein CkaCkLH20_05001 [Colletotrichum karsti]|uniref:GPI anchored serine-threonine rich protein n=1 Tax=Colletotrichum karsti TaxID=1095194 RepID=A0A9P6I8V3_9PEZI|nr:uncharacterized protein CkaCkLH20_05001 [Colletotrichum karsti]KAF9877301.1 hypothetical protein CkaCkLH20_05001 [Colletotrichum karsti]